MKTFFPAQPVLNNDAQEQLDFIAKTTAFLQTLRTAQSDMGDREEVDIGYTKLQMDIDVIANDFVAYPSTVTAAINMARTFTQLGEAGMVKQLEVELAYALAQQDQVDAA